jgi:chemotaxis protein CheC
VIAPRSVAILQELINIGVGKGAEVLNTLLNRHVVLAVPEVTQVQQGALLDALGIDQTQALSCVQMGYKGSLEGVVQLIFPDEIAEELVCLIIGENYAVEEFDFIRQATLTEVGNIVINAVIGTLSNIFGFSLQYTLPSFRGGTLAEIESQAEVAEAQLILVARTKFTIQELSVVGNMVLFFTMPTDKDLEEALESYVNR